MVSIDRVLVPQKSVFKLPYPLSESHIAILEEFRKHLQSVTSGDEKVVAIFETMLPLPGIALPWKDMIRVCHKEDVWCVDGAHSIGHEFDLDLATANPDFWMTNCSKWLFTKRGCSVLYVRLRNQDMIAPPLTPPLTYPTPGRKTNNFVSKFYWNGSTDLMCILSLEYALAFRRHIGGEKMINKYCHELSLSGGCCIEDILHTEVMESSTTSGELIGNMVNISLPLHGSVKPSGDLYLSYQDTMLSTYRVFAPLFHYRGKWWVRMSVHIYNDIDDFANLGKALLLFCQQLHEENPASIDSL